jgi:hypothetical protein
MLREGARLSSVANEENKEGKSAVPGACDLAEWNVPHAPYKHRSLLVEIDEDPQKGLAERG